MIQFKNTQTWSSLAHPSTIDRSKILSICSLDTFGTGNVFRVLKYIMTANDKKITSEMALFVLICEVRT